jgi:hypothetical protein
LWSRWRLLGHARIVGGTAPRVQRGVRSWDLGVRKTQSFRTPNS